MAAIGLAANQSAVARMAEELVVSPAVAQHFLDRIHRAALAVAGENGMQPVEHAAGRRGARAHAGATLLAARVGEGDDKKAA